MKQTIIDAAWMVTFMLLVIVMICGVITQDRVFLKTTGAIFLINLGLYLLIEKPTKNE